MTDTARDIRQGFLEASIVSSEYALKWLRARLVEALLKSERGLHEANQKWVIGLVKIERFDILEVLFEAGFGIANLGDDDMSLAMSGMIKDCDVYEKHPKVLAFAVKHMPLANALSLYNCVNKRKNLDSTYLIDTLVTRLAVDTNVINDDSGFNKPHIPVELLTQVLHVQAWRKYIAVDLSVYEFISFLTQYPQHMQAFEPCYVERFNGKMFWPYVNYLLDTNKELAKTDLHLFAYAKGKGNQKPGDRSVWPEQIFGLSKLLRLRQGATCSQAELWQELFVSAWADVDRVSRLEMSGVDLIIKIANRKGFTWQQLPATPVMTLLSGTGSDQWINGKTNEDFKKQRQLEVLFRLQAPCVKIMDILKSVKTADNALVECSGYAVAAHIEDNIEFKDQWVHWTLAQRYFKLFTQLVEEGIALNLNARERKFIIAKMPDDLFLSLPARLDNELTVKLFDQAIILKADIKASSLALYIRQFTEMQVQGIMLGEMNQTLKVLATKNVVATPALNRLAQLHTPEKGLTEILQKLKQ